MHADEIRTRFLEFFERNAHEVRPSASLVPADDPTLLFTNAGMVQFKKVFLGQEEVQYSRATTSQKCVRAGGKHNDLEQVGFTARHHTFFEMLGNFSFGDYFKRDAIRFAWDFLTEDLKIPREKLWVTVHYSDDEAAALWEEVAGLPTARIFRLGDKDNFWQMAETGPCGPCSEIHYDLRPEGELAETIDPEEFERRAEAGEFLEIWNLVFMQFDRDADGELHPLPAPSIDTGAGLERIASAMQGVRSNYETDLFQPLIERAAKVVGIPYEYESPTGVSYRVLADHARASAFLLADGVFPSNEGRGYVLRRILRRAVRHAWLMGRREPTLVEVVDEVIATMADAYPELSSQREHILRTTRAEEERFLTTIDDGMKRFAELAPEGKSGTISGSDAFRLYDTFGFPLDLTELMAEERGYTVDVEDFETELEKQRRRSRKDRAESGAGKDDSLLAGWENVPGAEDSDQEFAAYRSTELETDILAFQRINGRVAVQLRVNPFYAEGGGQVSDNGHIYGDSWTLAVDEVRRIGGRIAVIGDVEGDFEPGSVRAVVEAPPRRDTERNHTATHLLHAALRRVLGTHVHQQGSRVHSDRLRFDFSHTGPLTSDERLEVQRLVNEAIWANDEVCAHEMGYPEAIEKGAMALFSEKYGDVVRVIEIPGVSVELCGGTHVRTTGQIGSFRIVSESGVASGVRRIEAVTGRVAYERTVEEEALIQQLATTLKTPEANLLTRAAAITEEVRDLERQLQRARESSSVDRVGELLAYATDVAGVRVIARALESGNADEIRTTGDQLRERMGTGVAVLAMAPGEKPSLFAFVTDDLVALGIRADAIVRETAALVGGKGGGRPHMAQAGVGEPNRIPEALEKVPGIVKSLVAARAL